MHHKRPDDFGILAVCVFAFALLVAGALALVTAEALWRVRPWGYSASIAFAGSFVVMPIVLDPGWSAVAFSGVAALFIVVALSIVYRGLFPDPTLLRVPRAP